MLWQIPKTSKDGQERKSICGCMGSRLVFGVSHGGRNWRKTRQVEQRRGGEMRSKRKAAEDGKMNHNSREVGGKKVGNKGGNATKIGETWVKNRPVWRS